MQTEINKSGIYYSQNKDLSRKVILLNINGIENNFWQNENFTSPKLMLFQLSAYSENRYAVCRLVALKNNILGTVYTYNYRYQTSVSYFFHFSDL